MSNEEIVKKIQEWENDKEYLSLLWEKNQKLVNMIVHQLTGLQSYEEGFEDAKQQAFLGLWDAVRSYSPESGIKFFSYAPYQIKKALYHYHANSGYLVRVPEYLKTRFSKMQRFSADYRKRYGKNPDDETYMNVLNISKKSLDNLKNIEKAISQISLDSYISNDEGLEEIVTESVYFEELSKELTEAINILDPDGKMVILMHFYQNRPITYIAKLTNISRQGIYNQLEKAYKKIRDSKHGEILQTFLDAPYQPRKILDSSRRTHTRPQIVIKDEEKLLL